MRVIILDGTRFTDKKAAHEYIAESLCFPEYYGKNLDALYDCLSELDKETAVIIVNADAARSALDGYADGIMDCFKGALGESFRVCIFE